jgi:hypothetical protein
MVIIHQEKLHWGVGGGGEGNKTGKDEDSEHKIASGNSVISKAE